MHVCDVVYYVGHLLSLLLLKLLILKYNLRLKVHVLMRAASLGLCVAGWVGGNTLRAHAPRHTQARINSELSQLLAEKEDERVAQSELQARLEAKESCEAEAAAAAEAKRMEVDVLCFQNLRNGVKRPSASNRASKLQRCCEAVLESSQL